MHPPQPLDGEVYHSFDGNADVRCYNIDASTLKTMLRAENGLVMLDDGVIAAKRKLWLNFVRQRLRWIIAFQPV